MLTLRSFERWGHPTRRHCQEKTAKPPAAASILATHYNTLMCPIPYHAPRYWRQRTKVLLASSRRKAQHWEECNGDLGI